MDAHRRDRCISGSLMYLIGTGMFHSQISIFLSCEAHYASPVVGHEGDRVDGLQVVVLLDDLARACRSGLSCCLTRRTRDVLVLRVELDVQGTLRFE